MDKTEIDGTSQEKRLYDLIWKRTIASQMADAEIEKTTAEIGAMGDHKFIAQGEVVKFDGFIKVYRESVDDEEQQDDFSHTLPQLTEGQELTRREIQATERFTQGPQRYTEATLVRKMEELGIGRPSTYAATVDTLTRERGYAVKGDKEGKSFKVINLSLEGGEIKAREKTETVGAEKGKLLPQEIGLVVTDYLVGNFSDILDYDFTANIEEDFDRVAGGEMYWADAISAFYKPFHEHVGAVMADRTYSKVTREIGIAPDGEKVIASFGKFGAYVQKGEGENRKSASLEKDQLIETITLEEALKLLELPRRVGEIDGVEVIATKGRFGPYIKYGSKNFKLPRGKSPLTITLKECADLIAETPAEAVAPVVVADFGDIRIISGRYGPYIKKGESNYKIPKGTDAASLTEEDCKNIIQSTSPTGKFVRRNKK